MEAVLFIGIQATGKSTFFQHRFADTHVRINLDMLRTRHREWQLFETCLRIRQPFVVDNTNPSRAERSRYIRPAQDAGFRVVGYYFESRPPDAVRRNAGRAPERRIPEKGIYGTAGRLERPDPGEGFDALYYVRIAPGGGFDVMPWHDEAAP